MYGDAGQAVLGLHVVQCYSASLQEPSSIQKIAEIDQHIGVAMSGLTADAKTLIDRARVETQVLVSYLCASAFSASIMSGNLTP